MVEYATGRQLKIRCGATAHWWTSLRFPVSSPTRDSGRRRVKVAISAGLYGVPHVRLPGAALRSDPFLSSRPALGACEPTQVGVNQGHSRAGIGHDPAQEAGQVVLLVLGGLIRTDGSRQGHWAITELVSSATTDGTDLPCCTSPSCWTRLRARRACQIWMPAQMRARTARPSQTPNSTL